MREMEKIFGFNRGNSYLNNYLARNNRIGRKIKRIDRQTAARLYMQLVTSLVICLLIIIISNFENYSLIKKMVDGVRWVVRTNYDFKNAVYSFRNNLPGIDNSFKGISNNLEGILKNEGVKDATAAYKNSMAIPLMGKITSNFGVREDPISHEKAYHTGIDISGEKGAPIRCVLDGVVIKVEENKTLGKSVRIRHSGGIETLYGHCSEILVVENQQVRMGDYIAKVGDTGMVTAPHLHFEVFKEGKQIDPLSFIEGLKELK